MIDLSERQKLILSLVVRDYVESAEPVSSKQLVEHFNLDFSTATVRNDLAALTDMGYLRQPHTSAGRVPTESGYRYFVERLLGKANLPSDARSMIPPSSTRCATTWKNGCVWQLHCAHAR
jgi:heat-inducible transcriptional repressor